MSTPLDSIRRARLRRSARTVTAAFAVVALLSTGATPASGYWTAGGSATATAATATLAAATSVTVPVDATADVAISWTPGTGGIDPQGYIVTRHPNGLGTPVCASSATHPIDAQTCIDTAVPVGTYTYSVTSVYASWTATSLPSRAVTVRAPSPLGVAASYSIFSGMAVVSTGVSQVSGNLGVSPSASVTGFPPGTIGGEIHAGDANAADARVAVADAYSSLLSRPIDFELVGDLGGRTLMTGVYHQTAAMALTGTLTLDAGGNADAVFVLRTDAAFDTAAASRVILANGAQPSNVYWVSAGAAGTGANSFLSGTIVSAAAITLGAGTALIGRALSSSATVTMAAVTVRFTADPPPSITIDGGASAVTKQAAPTITGTTSAATGSVVIVSVSGQSLPTTVGSMGTWSVTATALTAGSHDIVAKVRDAAGNGSAARQTLTVEVNPGPIPLGAARTFSVLAATGIASTGVTRVSGDIGVSPSGSITGFPPGIVAGAMHAADPAAASAQTVLNDALIDGRARTPHTQITGNLGGQTFHIGIHRTSAALELTGDVTLDGQGDPNAVFIFVTDAAFNTAAQSNVILINGAQAVNVFWVVTGAAGTGAGSLVQGTILAEGAITLGAGAVLNGQALSQGTVTLAANVLDGVSPAVAP